MIPCQARRCSLALRYNLRRWACIWQEEHRLDNTRRGFLKVAMTAAGAAATPGLAQVHGSGQANEHAHQTVPSDLTLRVKSLESLLVEKGLVDRAALDAVIDTMEHKVGPRNGARVVARAWVDPA